MITDSRALAFDVLTAVLQRKRPLDDAFDEAARQTDMAQRDKGFARMLAATVIRHLGRIDLALDHFLDDPSRLPEAAMLCLRLGAAQLLCLGTPAHAAVDGSVRLAEARGQLRLKGLVNAVLRKVAQAGPELWEATGDARVDLPEWLWDQLCDDWGDDKALEIAASLLVEAPMDLTVFGDPAEWAEKLGAEKLPTGSLRRREGGQVTELPGFADGAWQVQDAAAALPARLLGNVAGLDVIDLCAAPGGKSAQLAKAGAKVTALDRSDKRVDRLRANLKRLGIEADCVIGDAEKWQPKQLADAVLLDAPCSATGVIRRHPDIMRLKGAEDVQKLAGLQRRILSRVAPMMKPGARFVYCTCSLLKAEGEEQVEHLVKQGGFARDPILPAEAPGLETALDADGQLRLFPSQWPDQGGIDGFFISRLKRV